MYRPGNGVKAPLPLIRRTRIVWFVLWTACLPSLRSRLFLLFAVKEDNAYREYVDSKALTPC
jgi:hypothetical protein